MRKLGTGAFATVWLCYDPECKTHVAIKRVKLTAIMQAHWARVQKEFKVLSEVTSPHTVRLLRSFGTKTTFCLVLEYCEEGDLAGYLTRHGKLEEKVARELVKQLCAALRQMREKGYVHRDLKPQNLLLTKSPSGQLILKLADFGFARVLRDGELATTVCGSPLYMAPEILKYRKYTTKAELWSLGVILYEMLTGHPPWVAETIPQLLLKIDTVALEFRESEFSAGCKALLKDLLSLEACKRPEWDQLWTHPFFVSQPTLEQNNLVLLRYIHSLPCEIALPLWIKHLQFAQKLPVQHVPFPFSREIRHLEHDAEFLCGEALLFELAIQVAVEGALLEMHGELPRALLSYNDAISLFELLEQDVEKSPEDKDILFKCQRDLRERILRAKATP